MKPLLTLALAFSLAPVLPTLAADAPATDAPKTTAPKTTAPDKPKDPDEIVFADPSLVPGVVPFAIKGSDLSGKSITLANYAGKPVLIDFWATWCPPCRAELPNVVANYNKYHAQGFEVLSISLDRDKSALTKYLTDHKDMAWSQIYDHDLGEEANAKRYGVKFIPFTVLVGQDGKIAATNVRGEELEPAIKAALAAK